MPKHRRGGATPSWTPRTAASRSASPGRRT